MWTSITASPRVPLKKYWNQKKLYKSRFQKHKEREMNRRGQGSVYWYDAERRILRIHSFHFFLTILSWIKIWNCLMWTHVRAQPKFFLNAWVFPLNLKFLEKRIHWPLSWTFNTGSVQGYHHILSPYQNYNFSMK